MPLFYVDASALVKLIRDEPETAALRSFIDDGGMATSALVLVEVPRAVRRAAAREASLPLDVLLGRAGELIDALALLPLEDGLLAAAGALAEPGLRALDAIHVASAVSLTPIDGFLSYDERQSAAARLAGLRTLAPGT